MKNKLFDYVFRANSRYFSPLTLQPITVVSNNSIAGLYYFITNLDWKRGKRGKLGNASASRRICPIDSWQPPRCPFCFTVANKACFSMDNFCTNFYIWPAALEFISNLILYICTVQNCVVPEVSSPGDSSVYCHWIHITLWHGLWLLGHRRGSMFTNELQRESLVRYDSEFRNYSTKVVS